MRDDTREPDIYEQRFMNILNDYKEDKVSQEEAVRKIFGVFADLMGG